MVAAAVAAGMAAGGGCGGDCGDELVLNFRVLQCVVMTVLQSVVVHVVLMCRCVV